MSDSYQHLFQNSFRTKPFFLWPKLSNLLPGLLTTSPSPAPPPLNPPPPLPPHFSLPVSACSSYNLFSTQRGMNSFFNSHSVEPSSSQISLHLSNHILLHSLSHSLCSNHLAFFFSPLSFEVVKSFPASRPLHLL